MFDITLNNGTSIPVLGLGVYKLSDETQMRTAVEAAIASGYRSFDTAQMYGNEALLGAALQNCGVPRSELFINSKADICNMGYDAALASFERTLAALGTDYLDMFMIHWPGQQRERLAETWRAFLRLMDEGAIRAAGVSNCEQKHIEWIGQDFGALPAVNQIERNIYQNGAELTAYCKARGIAVEAWAPLARGALDLPVITKIASAHGRTAAQIVLRWHIQSGCIVIPKSANPPRIAENADIFDFELTREECAALDALHTGRRTAKDPATYDF